MKAFNLATYVRKTTKSSGVPARIRNIQVLALIARLLGKQSNI